MDFTGVTGGIFGDTLIRSLIQSGHIFGAFSNHITAASLGLTLTEEIYRIPGSIVPQKGERVRHLLKKIHAVRVPQSSILEQHCSYLVRLRETLVLPTSVSAHFGIQHSLLSPYAHINLVCDGSDTLNAPPFGYVGELWVHIVPFLGPLSLTEETSPGNLSFFTKHSPLSLGDTLLLHHTAPLFFDADGNTFLPALANDTALSLSLNSQKSLEERRCIHSYAFGETGEYQSLSSQVPGAIFFSPNTSVSLFTEERIKLPPHLAGCLLRNGAVLGYLEPGFGNESEKGEPLLVPLKIEAHELWQSLQPLCTLVILPVSQEKEVPRALYTPPHEEKGETE